MTPYALSKVKGDELKAALLHDLAAAQRFMEALPERTELGPDGKNLLWSCHGVVRALRALAPEHPFALTLMWRVMDGSYGSRGYNHSWLEVGSATDRSYWLLLDVYPVGALSGPILLDMWAEGPMLYKTPRYDVAELEAEGVELSRALAALMATA
jgi:hypothetical protein